MALTRAQADPWAAPGDMALRHDVQLLADAGVIRSPVSAWPIPWATINADLSDNRPDSSMSPAVATAYQRVRQRSRAVMQTSGIQPSMRLAGSSSPRRIRNFEATPTG